MDENSAHNNIDIFNFKFVNRSKERNELYNFIYQEKINVLWVNGVRGVGKSFFLNKCIGELNKDNSLIYYHVNIDENENSYIEKILIALSEDEKGLTKYIKNNYKMILLDFTKNILNKTIIPSDYQEFASILFDKAKNLKFQKTGGRQHSLEKVLLEYLLDMRDRSKIVLILDNFMYCDNESLDILENVLKTISLSENLKVIIVTTDENMLTDYRITKFLIEKILHTRLTIAGFDKDIYFKKILAGIFGNEEKVLNISNDLFNLCKGRANELKNFIRNLYLKNGLTVNKKGIKINYEVFYKLICSRYINFDFLSLSRNQRIIVETIALFNHSISIKILFEYFSYVTFSDDSSQYIKMTKRKISEIVAELIDLNIIIEKPTHKGIHLTFSHDSIYIAMKMYLKDHANTALKNYKHELISSFLLENEKKLIPDLLTKEENDYILAYQSYCSQSDNWISLNFKVAYFLFEKQEYTNSLEHINRILNYSIVINDKYKLFASRIHYEIGDYAKSENIINAINIELLSNKNKITFLIIKGKIKSFKDPEKALHCYEKALSLLKSDSKKVELLYLILMCINDFIDQANKGRKLFRSIVDNKNIKKNHSRYLGYIYRCSVYFCSRKESNFYLSKALIIAKKNNDHLELGRTYNNISFFYLNNSEYSTAKKYIIKSITLLSNIKLHEVAYPLTNLILILMKEKNWNEAIQKIQNTRLWNRSYFIEKVLKLYEMIVSFYSGDNIKTQKLIKFLLVLQNSGELLDCHSNYNILINIAIIRSKQGYRKEALEMCTKCKIYISTSTTQSEYADIIQQISEENVSIDFRPWIVTFGHD